MIKGQITIFTIAFILLKDLPETTPIKITTALATASIIAINHLKQNKDFKETIINSLTIALLSGISPKAAWALTITETLNS